MLILWFKRYGFLVGLAFQIIDDILDIEGDGTVLGKAIGGDQRLQKATYPGVVGVEQARRKACDLISQAKHSLKSLGETVSILEGFADLVVSRRK
jgi:geranylgeranyl pyrophosphate synthase